MAFSLRDGHLACNQTEHMNWRTAAKQHRKMFRRFCTAVLHFARPRHSYPRSAACFIGHRAARGCSGSGHEFLWRLRYPIKVHRLLKKEKSCPNSTA